MTAEQKTISELERTSGRKLTSGVCRCGLKLSIFVRPGEPVVCGDCRDANDRAQHGWRPENSLN